MANFSLPYSGFADDTYHTPLAGEPFETTVFGEKATVEARDRANTRALSLGVTLYTPTLASTDALPIAALYWRKETEQYRSRVIFSLFANEWDGAIKTKSGLEFCPTLKITPIRSRRKRL